MSRTPLENPYAKLINSVLKAILILCIALTAVLAILLVVRNSASEAKELCGIVLSSSFATPKLQSLHAFDLATGAEKEIPVHPSIRWAALDYLDRVGSVGYFFSTNTLVIMNLSDYTVIKVTPWHTPSHPHTWFEGSIDSQRGIVYAYTLDKDIYYLYASDFVENAWRLVTVWGINDNVGSPKMVLSPDGTRFTIVSRNLSSPIFNTYDLVARRWLGEWFYADKTPGFDTVGSPVAVSATELWILVYAFPPQQEVIGGVYNTLTGALLANHSLGSRFTSAGRVTPFGSRLLAPGCGPKGNFLLYDFTSASYWADWTIKTPRPRSWDLCDSVVWLPTGCKL